MIGAVRVVSLDLMMSICIFNQYCNYAGVSKRVLRICYIPKHSDTLTLPNTNRPCVFCLTFGHLVIRNNASHHF